MGVKGYIDRFQQRRRRLAITVATLRKFNEDHTGDLAAMVAFWAFFSIFPLLLVFVTVLGYTVPADTKEDVLGKVSQLFPLLNPDEVGTLSGSLWPLLLGGITALWSGTAVMRTAQSAFDAVWEIPEKDRAGLVRKVARSLLALFTIGAGLVAATLVSGVLTGKDVGLDLGVWGRVGGLAVTAVFDVLLFIAGFRLLTPRDVVTREVLPGALLSGVAFFILQQASSLIISRYLGSAESTYGSFATVITILWWFLLQAQITMLGAQLNVVLKDRLYPRSLFGGPTTPADHRALRAYARQRTYHEQVDVEARFIPEPKPEERPPRPAR